MTASESTSQASTSPESPQNRSTTSESVPGSRKLISTGPESPPSISITHKNVQNEPTFVYNLPRDPSIQTRHLVVYNTGPAVGVDEMTIRRVFEAYGSVERVLCPNPASARVLVTFDEVSAAARAKAERNRPPEVEERVRLGLSRAAEASDVFAPKPGEPCPLLGRWLKVSFADIRVRGTSSGKADKKSSEGGPPPPPLPAHLADFKAFDALAAGGAASCDSRQTPCPLCGRSCGGQRGLRMHLVDAHPLEIRDREHLVRLLQQGGASLPPQINGNSYSMEQEDGTPDGVTGAAPSPSVGAGAAAKGRANAALPPAFAAARAGDLDTVRRLVEGGDSGDPVTAMDKNGSSPLDWAAGEGRLEVCRYLVTECGVDPGRACPIRGRGEGRTALHWAARGGHEEVCRFLLETPRSIGAPDSSGGNKTGAAIESYVGADTPAAEGTTPMHWACWGAHLSTCRLLFSRGADHRRVNAYGCTVAHWCGLSGSVDVCSWLAKGVEDGGAGGLDWAKTNLQGHTICHKAALKGHRGLLEWLRRKTEESVIPECAWGKDEGGYTPENVARLAGFVDLAEWLRINGTG